MSPLERAVNKQAKTIWEQGRKQVVALQTFNTNHQINRQTINKIENKQSSRTKNHSRFFNL